VSFCNNGEKPLNYTTWEVFLSAELIINFPCTMEVVQFFFLTKWSKQRFRSKSFLHHVTTLNPA